MKLKMAIFLLVLSGSVEAQEQNKDQMNAQFTGGIGVSFQNFNGLNDRIAKFPQYKTLSDYMVTFELGMLKEQRRFISDINFMVGSSLSNHDERASVTRFLGVNIGFGYDLLKEKNIMLYPLAGLGLEGIQGRFYKDNSAVPFDSLLQSSSVQPNLHSIDFTNYFFCYRLGFGLSFKSDKQPYGSIGIRAVYTGSFNSHSWKSNQEQSLRGAPEDNLSQFQIALTFGMPANNQKMH